MLQTSRLVLIVTLLSMAVGAGCSTTPVAVKCAPPPSAPESLCKRASSVTTSVDLMEDYNKRLETLAVAYKDLHERYLNMLRQLEVLFNEGKMQP